MLNLAAVAEEDERIRVGEGKFHTRKKGEALHQKREPLPVLTKTRAQVGPDIFAAQYQQRPTPPGGNMIKREWIRRYEALPARTSATHVVQSYDTASKEGAQNSFSVCTTWHVHPGKYHLAEVMKGQFDYPTLKAKAIAHAQKHKPTTILVEDTGVGTALAAELT